MELCSYAAQRPDAYQERIAIVVDGFGRQVEESERLLIGHAGLNPTAQHRNEAFPEYERWQVADRRIFRNPTLWLSAAFCQLLACRRPARLHKGALSP